MTAEARNFWGSNGGKGFWDFLGLVGEKLDLLGERNWTILVPTRFSALEDCVSMGVGLVMLDYMVTNGRI